MAIENTGPEPHWLRIARQEVGVREIKGGPNARINEYLATVGAKPGSDWCAGFVAWVMTQAGLPHPGKPTARSWRTFATSISEPRVGAVVLLSRPPETWTGHVGFLVGESPRYLHLLGGNQGKAVSIRRYDKSRLLALRWPA